MTMTSQALKMVRYEVEESDNSYRGYFCALSISSVRLSSTEVEEVDRRNRCHFCFCLDLLDPIQK